MQKLGGRQAIVECWLLIGGQAVLHLFLHQAMSFHGVRYDTGEKEHEDEKHNDGAQIVEAVTAVLVLFAYIADEQNLR